MKYAIAEDIIFLGHHTHYTIRVSKVVVEGRKNKKHFAVENNVEQMSS